MTAFVVTADVTVLHVLYSLRSLTGVYIFLGISEFGNLWTIVGLTVCSVLALFLLRRYAYIPGLLVSTGLAGFIIVYLKPLIALPRPDVYYQAYQETGLSFPSGHAAGATAFYGFLVFMAFRELPKRGKFVALVLMLLIFLIGFSRLYLGVHYLSDVLGGFAIGVLCDLAGIAVFNVAKHRFG